MTTEVAGRRYEMLNPNVFTEQPVRVRGNRKEELRLSVQPTLLAEKGAPRGVTLYYRERLIVLTEASAITLANSINDALEMEIPSMSTPLTDAQGNDEQPLPTTEPETE